MVMNDNPIKTMGVKRANREDNIENVRTNNGGIDWSNKEGFNAFFPKRSLFCLNL